MNPETMNSEITLSSEITLHDYHLLYPQTAGSPTLVQSGLIALLLERQRRKEARKARRRAWLQRVGKRLFGNLNGAAPNYHYGTRKS